MSDLIIPDELREALAGDAAASLEFDRIPPSHKREYIDWITEAVKSETRLRRSEKALAMLKKSAAAHEYKQKRRT